MNPPDNQHGQIHASTHSLMPATTSVRGDIAQHREIRRSVISVEEILRYMRKFWLVALVLGLCFGVGAYFYLQSRPPVYESTAVIVLNNDSSKHLNLKTVQPAERSEYNLPQMVNNLSNEIGSNKFRRSYYQAISPELRAQIMGKAPAGESEDAERAFLSRLGKMVNISVLKDSHMISVTAKSDDSGVAVEVANSYVKHFSDYAGEQELAMTRKVLAFLSAKAEDLLATVKRQEQELLAYRKSKGVTNAQGESDFIADKITVLNTQLADARLQEERLRDIMIAIDEIGNNPEERLKVPALAENVTLEKAFEKLSEARARVAELKTDFGRKHPTMRHAVSQQESALDNLAKLVDQTVSSMRRQLTSAGQKIVSLESRVKETKQEMIHAGNISVSQQLLEQQLKSSRELYNSLILQRSETTLALQFSGVDRVRVTDNAIEAEDPVFPNKPLSAVVGIIAFSCCFFGIPLTLGFGQRVLTVLREGDQVVAEPQLQAPVDASRALPVHGDTAQHPGFPVLATFPSADRVEAGPWVRSVVDQNAPSGAELKAFVRNLTLSKEGNRGLIITSESAQPAKTLTAAAVCLAASRQGLSTLLVSIEKLVPSIEPRLRNGRYQATSDESVKTSEEMLAPFTTDESNLYFITDEAWKRIPLLCLETLCHASSCVDLVVLDAPLVPDETSLRIMAQFASNCVLVRGSQEFYNYPVLRSKLQHTMPECFVQGVFVVN